MYDESGYTKFSAEVYHASEDKSTVYIAINLDDLIYLPGTQTETRTARFKIYYELFYNYESKIPLDTGSYIYSDDQHFGSGGEMTVDFDIPVQYLNDYLLNITLIDLNRQDDNDVFRFYDIVKSNKNTAQNFLVTDNDRYPIFEKHINAGQYFKIQCAQMDTGLIYIRYYDRELPLARTPFSTDKNITFKFDPDSIYSVNVANGITELLELPYPGIYHFQTDIKQTEGLTLFGFDDGFPNIETPLQAILPLRYLTAQKEYDALLASADYKATVDNFWLKRASHQPERAKNMIARYYQRVWDSNMLFASYQEGWKTDRGIIYIIYGPPSEVYRKTGEEEWIYGERGNPLSIKFYFYQVENPFTQNDYSLQRLPTYKTSWYIAIENWRR
ncbi:MAG: GWxTD domain-containing protein [Bacteroidales bacterium]|nr:GWxTD domain-containing protein [Bacteroidales bacterium]